MGERKIKKILVIRFRQIGDATLATALCSTLKRSFPGAELHFVLNKGIAPLFEGHPDIDRVITFDKHELRPMTAYLRKVSRVVRDEHYDVIIDMRSTIRTLFFSLFSPGTRFRIGRRKSYTRFILNHAIDHYDPVLDIDMVKRNLLLLKPLEEVAPIHYTNSFYLDVSDREHDCFRAYMERSGVDFKRPVMLVGVTTKIATKRWDTGKMTDVLRRFIDSYPLWQLIFNYAPGVEEADARAIMNALGNPSNVLIDVQAGSLRELAALCANCDCYFGNEGGARHIVQAMGVPSLALFSPGASKSMWLPLNDIVAEGVDVTPETDADSVYHLLSRFIERLGK